ncbi:hypothetical protein AB1Y20_023336 [Prymnesium parvum]
MDIAFVDMWLSLLRYCSWGKVGAGDDNERREAINEGKALGDRSTLVFEGLTLGAHTPACLDPTIVKSFDDARAIYLKASGRAARAKKFYVMDGFVTSHFEVLNREVSLYQVLCAWETDLARRLAIQKRRLALLEPLDELNEKAYTQIVRQGLFDRGTINAEMLEIKHTMHVNDPPLKRNKKLAPLVEATVQAYTAFIQRFENKDGGGLPTRVETEAEGAFLTAHFHLARALSRLDEVESLRKSLHSYEYLHNYYRRNKVEGMESEEAVCKEMVELLPRRIAKLNAGITA